jgi:hypothetical protein
MAKNFIMKITILLFFLIANSSFAQSVHDTALLRTVGTTINLDSVRRSEFQLYIDSLNQYKGGHFPKFVFNKCFDLQGFFWPSFHSPVSLRWKVLSGVNSKSVLVALLKSKDKRLKEKCYYGSTPYPNLHIPMLDQSFYELISKRLQQMK